jgi:hypothetical protein
MKAGDRIRVQKYCMGHPSHLDDYTVEEFRHCLGVFLSEARRTAEEFTPLCELYEPGPDSVQGYIANYGEYHTNMVQGWMDIPAPEQGKANECI